MLNFDNLVEGSANRMARAAASEIVTVCPQMMKVDGRRVLRLPLEAGYGGPDFDVDDIPTA